MNKQILKQEFYEIDKKTQKIFLTIGDYHVSKDKIWLGTLLGSCVAVCLFDKKVKVGGMNHIFLPGKTEDKTYSDSARYSINAMEILINSMMKYGAQRKNIEAKIFGGAKVISGISGDFSVGPKISELVLSFLKTEDIKITVRDLGGTRTRKLFFNTGTGEVLVRKSVSSFIHLEKRRLDQVRKVKIKNDITLF